MEVSVYDKLSVALGLQQVIGACTVVWNVIEVALDIFKLISQAVRNAVIEKEIIHYTKQMNAPENSNIVYSKEIEMLQKISQRILREDSALNDHVKSIGIGFLRLTPIVGTIYSAVIWRKGASASNPVVDS